MKNVIRAPSIFTHVLICPVLLHSELFPGLPCEVDQIWCLYMWICCDPILCIVCDLRTISHRGSILHRNAWMLFRSFTVCVSSKQRDLTPHFISQEQCSEMPRTTLLRPVAKGCLCAPRLLWSAWVPVTWSGTSGTHGRPCCKRLDRTPSNDQLPSRLSAP